MFWQVVVCSKDMWSPSETDRVGCPNPWWAKPGHPRPLRQKQRGGTGVLPGKGIERSLGEPDNCPVALWPEAVSVSFGCSPADPVAEHSATVRSLG